MNAFDKNWSNQNRASAGDKLKEALAAQSPLRPKIETAANKLQAKMAFEQVSMRLSTIHDMGDVMVTLGPAITSIKSLKPGLGKFVPGADSEINTMQTLLNGIMMESLQSNSSGIEMNIGSGSDIDQIMMEASAVAEQKMNDKFPSIPTGSFRISDTESQQ
jgi:division protein CdvB (Snf7/Vps24/ESCRT-III family)